MLSSSGQLGPSPGNLLFGSGNSNDAKMRLLERRMRTDSPSPRNLFQGGSFGGQVSHLTMASSTIVVSVFKNV